VCDSLAITPSEKFKIIDIIRKVRKSEAVALNFQVPENQPGPCCSDRKFNPLMQSEANFLIFTCVADESKLLTESDRSI